MSPGVPLVGLIPALSILIGAAVSSASNLDFTRAVWILPVVCAATTALWWRRSGIAAVAAVACGFAIAAAALGSHARTNALTPSLRQVLDQHVGGFSIDTIGPERDHDPMPVRVQLIEDAAPRDGFVSLRAQVIAIAPRGSWLPTDGGVSLSVGGDAATGASSAWRAGRTLEAAVSFRRPGRYLNDGVPDFERDLALDGTALFGSVKSGLGIEVIEHGNVLDEMAGDVRVHVRRAVGRWIAPHDSTAAAVVTAVLIGDRSGLPPEVRDRLQAAGTYHVIAISGGNIAILAGLVIAVLAVTGIRGRLSSLIAVGALIFYTEVATSGPSVWRATLMAIVYFTARVFDHRTAAWQAASVAAAVMVVVRPLDIRDPGFVLTFGATAALLEAARRGRTLLPSRGSAWIAASILASLATEVALLPVSAQAFSRVTAAGLVLNVVAVPMMGIAQIAGVVVVAFSAIHVMASSAGWVAYMAAHTLIESSKLVDVAPWLTLRVPSPGAVVVSTYYLSLAVLLCVRRFRRWGAAGLALSVVLIVGGSSLRRWSPPEAATLLRWTIFDVGQGEATLLQLDDRTLQIDAGGAPFGNTSFDIGTRVLMPAIWARGAHALDTLLVTHGDPDHIGGAPALNDALSPDELWEGIVVPSHAPMSALRDEFRAQRAHLAQRRAGESFAWGSARIRVLHPEDPDWERPRVRNDDSVVLEVVYNDVALLLTGDISAEIEREIAPRLSLTPIRILKVAHHGSRTSTSRGLLETWRPQYAVISAGRGNTFGHPTPEVLGRLEAIGAAIYRTDLHGQITIETDGHRVDVRTYVGDHEVR